MKFESKKQLRERIKDLEENLRVSDRHIDILSETIDTLKKQFDNTPKDCKLGKYCRACIHGDVIANTLIRGSTIYICRKGDTCKSFIPKDE